MWTGSEIVEMDSQLARRFTRVMYYGRTDESCVGRIVLNKKNWQLINYLATFIE